MAKKKTASRKTIRWNRADWTQSDYKIAQDLDCAVSTVANKRKSIMAAAEAMGLMVAKDNNIEDAEEKEATASQSIEALIDSFEPPKPEQKKKDPRPLPDGVLISEVPEDERKHPDHRYNMTIPFRNGFKTFIVYEQDGYPDYKLYLHFVISAEDQSHGSSVTRTMSSRTLPERYPHLYNT